MRDIRSPFDGFRSPFGARGGFNPLALFAASEPGAWYDPSDIATLFQDAAGTTPVTAAGQPVGLVLDKSGRGNHASQPTAAARPTYQSSGGLSWLAFDGVDDFLVTGTITPGVDKAQVFAGVRKLATGPAAVIAELSTNINAQLGAFVAYIEGTSAANGYGMQSRGAGSLSVAAVNSGFAQPITNVFTGLGDISGDLATLRVNSVQVAQSTADQGTGNYLAYPLYIGRRGGASLPFNGNLYSLIVRFGANLDAARIEQVERYVAARTGVTL